MDSRNYLCESPDFDAAETLTQKDFDDVLSKIGPRTYTLTIPERFGTQNARIFVIGCQGSGSEWQKKVADLMNQEASKAEPLITIVLGDNIYNTGASSPLDKKFRTQFFDMHYPGPLMIDPGNHDGNYDKKSAMTNYLASFTTNAVKQTVGWEVEKQEVLVTYLPTKTHTLSEQVTTFQQSILNRDQLPAWNMPYVFYSLIVGEKEFFFINSNSIFIDYLIYLEKKDNNDTIDPLKNQIAWLKQQYTACIAAERMPILVSHHPADLTLGKRMTSPDAWHYASDEQLTALNKRLHIEPRTKSFNILFKRLLAEETLTFPFKLSAHDHYIHYLNDHTNNVCQLTMGGSGGALHSFLQFNYPKSGCEIEQYGFAVISVPLTNKKAEDRLIDIDIYTIDGLHLKFNTKDHLPIRESGSQAFEQMRDTVMRVSSEFFEGLKSSAQANSSFSIGFFGRSMKFVSDGLQAYQNITKKTTTKKEPGVVQDIVAYFNQYQPPSVADAIAFLHEKISILKQIPPETASPFITYLRRELPECFTDSSASVTQRPTQSQAKVVFDE